MRKILKVVPFTIGCVLAVLIGLVGSACNADLRSNAYPTDVTFTIEGFHQKTLDTVASLVDVVVVIPGHGSFLAGDDVPLPFRYTARSSEFTQVQYNVEITGKLIEPNADVRLRCTWSAQTPAGRRLSRDASDSEGESRAGAPVTCHYSA